MIWSLIRKRKRRGWCSCAFSPCCGCYLRHYLYCMCQYWPVSSSECQHEAPPGAKGKDPVSKRPGWLNLDIPMEAVIMKIFSCRGDGEQQLLKEPRFYSCETTHPSTSNPGACWIVVTFKSTFKWELLLWNCVLLSSRDVCAMGVSYGNIFSAGTFMDGAIELSGSPDQHHLYFKR